MEGWEVGGAGKGGGDYDTQDEDQESIGNSRGGLGGEEKQEGEQGPQEIVSCIWNNPAQRLEE